MPRPAPKPEFQQAAISNDEVLLTSAQVEDAYSIHFTMKTGNIEKVIIVYPYTRSERPQNRHVELTIRLNGLISEKLVGCSPRKWKDFGAFTEFYGA